MLPKQLLFWFEKEQKKCEEISQPKMKYSLKESFGIELRAIVLYRILFKCDFIIS